MGSRIVFFLCAACFGLLLISCDREGRQLRKSQSRAAAGRQIISRTMMRAYDGELLLWKLEADRMLRENSQAPVLVVPVYMELFDEDRALATTVTADSGYTDESLGEFKLWGEVRIETADGKTIQSQSLYWNNSDRILTSPDYVEIETASGEIMRGKGFEAAEDFSWWSFHSNVAGQFSDFNAMIQEKDGDTRE
jgi:LPS export ABC transporter protein LptC